MLTDLTISDIKSMTDEVLVLTRASLKRLPSCDNENGRTLLACAEEEIKNRNIDSSQVLKNLLPQ
jgi:hypothetical protein